MIDNINLMIGNDRDLIREELKIILLSPENSFFLDVTNLFLMNLAIMYSFFFQIRLVILEYSAIRLTNKTFFVFIIIDFIQKTFIL